MSCYKCNQIGGIDIKPFLFLSFEDILYYPTYTYYVQTLKPTNPMKKPPHLDEYRVMLGGIQVSGEAIRCLRVQTSSFYDNSSKLITEIIDSFKSPLQTCSLFIVNVLRYSLAQISVQNTKLHKDSIYCAACEPKYRPTIYSDIYVDVKSQYSIE